MAEDNVHVINSKNDFTAEVESGTTMVVHFTATWCAPCRVMIPFFAVLSRKYESIKFLKIDVDEFKDIAADYEVRAMPTFLFIKEGIVLDKMIGANREELESKVKVFASEEDECHSSMEVANT